MTISRWHIVSAGLVLFTALLTFRPLIDAGAQFAPGNAQLLVVPKTGDLAPTPGDFYRRPLISDLNRPPSRNPFTLDDFTYRSDFLSPPAPRVELPTPPPLPHPAPIE